MDQVELFDSEEQATRSILDQLLDDSRLFEKSQDFKDLLDFVVKLRNFAPFNAMLLQIQKPGLSYAASAREWRDIFNRTIKEDARPLLILWPFGPVALVYDIADTLGDNLPKFADAFPANGCMEEEDIVFYKNRMEKRGIYTTTFDGGDNKAGSITEISTTADNKKEYQIKINNNHGPNTKFATLSHELGHLFLGHLGLDAALKVPDRRSISDQQKELEAESVAYLVCCRNGVDCESQAYLSSYVETHTTVDSLDLYRVMRASGRVENLLGLDARSSRI